MQRAALATPSKYSTHVARVTWFASSPSSLKAHEMILSSVMSGKTLRHPRKTFPLISGFTDW